METEIASPVNWHEAAAYQQIVHTKRAALFFRLLKTAFCCISAARKNAGNREPAVPIRNTVQPRRLAKILGKLVAHLGDILQLTFGRLHTVNERILDADELAAFSR